MPSVQPDQLLFVLCVSGPRYQWSIMSAQPAGAAQQRTRQDRRDGPTGDIRGLARYDRKAANKEGLGIEVMTDKLDYLRSFDGMRWRRARWTRPPNNPEWDHDHCVACWAKFSDTIPGTFHEGYTTGPDHGPGIRNEWVCDECFFRLKEELRWTASEVRTPPNST